MADEDIESGGQTDDSDTGSEEPEAEAPEAGERQAATEDIGEKPKSRGERRRDVVRQNAMAKAAAEQEAREVRSRLAQSESALAEMRARMEERERNTQTTGKKEQAQAKIAKLRDQAWLHLERSATAKDPASARQEREEYQRLLDEAEDERRELWMETERTRLRGEISGALPNQEVMEERQYLQAKYPQVVSSVEGRSLADGRYSALIANGRPPGRATMEEAITYAASKLGLGGNRAPSDASRQRYVGMGSRDGESDGGGTGGTMTAEDVKNNLALKRMALNLFKQDDEHVAYEKFAKQIGTKALRPD